MKSIGAVFMTGCPSWRQPNVWDAISTNSNMTLILHFLRTDNFARAITVLGGKQRSNTVLL